LQTLRSKYLLLCHTQLMVKNKEGKEGGGKREMKSYKQVRKEEEI
jgi:hypothetical protein